MDLLHESQPKLTQPAQLKVYASDASDPIEHSDVKQIVGGVSKFLFKEGGGTGIAVGAWKLTTIPQVTTDETLTTFLTNNNVSSEAAPTLAAEIRQLLANPLVRALLLGVCGAAFMYAVVEHRSKGSKTKWVLMIAVFIIGVVLYLLLHHFGIMR